MKKKYFLICSFLYFAPLTILAQTFTQGNLTYSVISGTNVSVKAKDYFITTANIPGNVTNAGSTYTVVSIAENAFAGCQLLTVVTIPNSVTSIESTAFSNCSTLPSIIIPGSVTTIEDGVFEFCHYLNSVVIPNSVTSLGDSAFFGCSGLVSVTLPDFITSIEDSTFEDCTSLKSFNFPVAVTSIGKLAFFNCSSLTLITIPDTVKSIGQGAFAYCSKLTSINIPDAVTGIENYTFNECSALTSITIPNSVTKIGLIAFAGCSKLTSITIPGSVKSIGYMAFHDCSALNTVTVLNPTPVIINPDVFGAVIIANIPLIVPAGSESAYKTSAVWKDFKSVTTLSVTDFGKENKISIFPNPSTGIFNIQTDEDTALEVYDVLGKHLKSQKTDAGVSKVDLSGSNAGIYFLKAVNSLNQIKTLKLIKQ